MPTESAARSAAETVEEFFRCMTEQDIEGALAVIHPDIEMFEPESLPYGGRHAGIEAFQRDLLGVMLAKVDLTIDSARVLDAGAEIVGYLSATLTARSTGESLQMEFVEIYEIADGRIRRADVYPKDTKALAEFLAA